VRPLATLSAAILVAGALAACQVAQRTPRSADPDQHAVQAHLAELADKIASLEGRLSSAGGAFRDGPNLVVEGGGRESVLERQRRIDRELAATKAALASREQELAAVRIRLNDSTSRGTRLAEQSDALGHVRDSLETARQELAERQVRLNAASEQLAVSELQRLRGERAYYLLAAELLKLVPGQSQELVDLQVRVRQQVKDVGVKESVK
jgi:hypothetical protein